MKYQRLKHTFKHLISYSIPVVIFYFLAMVIVRQWDMVKEYSWDFNLPFLIVSFLFLFITLLLVIILWRRVLIQLGSELSLPKAFKIFHLSNLGRYVPGKIWQFVGMYYMLEKENIGVVKAVSGTLWASLFFNLSGIIIGVLTIYFSGFELFQMSLPVLILFLVAVFSLIQPRVIDSVMNYLMKRLNQKKVVFSLPLRQVLINLLGYATLWFCYGVGFFLLTKSVTDVSLDRIFIFVGLFSIAHVVGYLSFLTPGGIGVREGVLTYMLSYYIPFPVASIVAILARVWLTLGEFVCAIVALRIK